MTGTIVHLFHISLNTENYHDANFVVTVSDDKVGFVGILGFKSKIEHTSLSMNECAAPNNRNGPITSPKVSVIYGGWRHLL